MFRVVVLLVAIACAMAFAPARVSRMQVIMMLNLMMLMIHLAFILLFYILIIIIISLNNYYYVCYAIVLYCNIISY